jgi:hypothetical protein
MKYCKNCGHPVHDLYCGHCGQKANPERISFTFLWKEVFHFLLILKVVFYIPLFKWLPVPGKQHKILLRGKGRITNLLSLIF